jgi:hypothetical protein
MTDTDWDALVKQLDAWRCTCGASGPLSCTCGENRIDPDARDVLRAIIRELRPEPRGRAT